MHYRKNWYSGDSLSRQLNLSYIIVIFIPMLLLAFLSNTISTNILVRKTIDNSVQNLNIIHEGLESHFRHIEHLTRIIVTNDNIQNVLNEPENARRSEIYDHRSIAREYLNYVVGSGENISSAVIYSKDGWNFGSGAVDSGVLGTSGFSVNDLLELSSEKYGELVWIDIHPVKYHIGKDSTNCLSVVRAVIGADSGLVLGALEVNVEERIFADIYSNKKRLMPEHIFLVNGEGRIISSSREDEIFDSIKNTEYFPWILQDTSGGKNFNLNGSSHLVTYTRLDRMNWTIIGLIPMDSLVTESRNVTFLIFGIGALCIFLASISSVFISRSITQPIVTLSKSMARAGQGDLEVRVQIEGSDEIRSLSATFNSMLEKISGLMNAIYSEQKKKREFELMAIQSQINPHFLYNTMESVYSLAQLGRTDEVLKMVNSLTGFYRVALSDGRNIIRIKDEIKIVENYLTIQKIRYMNKFFTEIDMDDDILDCSIIKLSIQPIVENAIYHGLRKKRETGLIRIRGKKEKDLIHITIEDNGAGIEAGRIGSLLSMDSPSQGGKSFGLRSVNERIQLYFGSRYGIVISSEYGIGTTVKITLPAAPRQEDFHHDENLGC